MCCLYRLSERGHSSNFGIEACLPTLTTAPLNAVQKPIWTLRRIIHDAKTAEGGSGALLFGQTGKVHGQNFGVFTESNAANMAVPIRFALDLLKRAGWKLLEEIKNESVTQNQTASANTNNSTTQNKAQ